MEFKKIEFRDVYGNYINGFRLLPSGFIPRISESIDIFSEFHNKVVNFKVVDIKYEVLNYRIIVILSNI